MVNEKIESVEKIEICKKHIWQPIWNAEKINKIGRCKFVCHCGEMKLVDVPEAMANKKKKRMMEAREKIQKANGYIARQRSWYRNMSWLGKLDGNLGGYYDDTFKRAKQYEETNDTGYEGDSSPSARETQAIARGEDVHMCEICCNMDTKEIRETGEWYCGEHMPY